MSQDHRFNYDVALSFAGEDRPFVARVARALVEAGVTVFYDEYETATLWGKDLYTHLRDVYQNQARYTILFASEHYVRKVWTGHERESAQARAIQEQSEYILPARFDDTTIPGLLPTTGYIDLRRVTPEELAQLVLEKLGRRPGSWETPGLPRLPGENKAREESLLEKAERLAKTHKKNVSRADLLQSQAGVKLARTEIKRLHEYIAAQVKALKEADSDLQLYCEIRHDGVLLVNSPKASFTMYWSQPYVNGLANSNLFTGEFNRAHSFDVFHQRQRADSESHIIFDVDDDLRPRWKEDDVSAIQLSTEQLADRFLSRVIDRAYSSEPVEEGDDYEDE